MMFSVVIPAYNAERFITYAVNSVLNQTYKEFEVIIIDDGSEDGTRALIGKYEDNRIRYIYQENSGVSSARNRGILESTGKYICFLDSDDEWKVNHLEVLKKLIKKYDQCGMYITGYDLRLHNGEIIQKSKELLNKITTEDIFSSDGYDFLIRNGYFFNTNTVCCRRDVFDKVGLFANGIKNGEDDDMWLRIFAYYSIAISKKNTTIYNRMNCSATAHRVISEHKFLERIDVILASSEVPEYRKKSLLVWNERHKLSQARKHIISGNKKSALDYLKVTDYKKVSRRKYLETVLCLFIPSNLIKMYINRRDVGYYE